MMNSGRRILEEPTEFSDGLYNGDRRQRGRQRCQPGPARVTGSVEVALAEIWKSGDI